MEIKEWDKEEFFEEETAQEQSNGNRGFLGLLLIIAVIFIGRLVYLQITEGYFFRYLAEGNSLRWRALPAPRGLIIDANGQPLVKNDWSYDLSINPLNLPAKTAEKQSIINELKEIYPDGNLDKEKILKGAEEITIKSGLSHEEMLAYKIKIQNLAGVTVKQNLKRNYFSQDGLSHILGYIGKVSDDDLRRLPNYKTTDLIGKTGLEAVYENKLKGSDGREKMEVNSRGQIQRFLGKIDPQIGNNLRLWLDLGLQERSLTALQEQLAVLPPENQSVKAVAIALNPQTGGVLAMVSLPFYDNNIFSSNQIKEEYQKILDNPDKPLFNRAVSGLYPSGSVIKPVMAAAGLEERVINEQTTINDPGEIKIGDWVFPDWKNHGSVDVKKAIAESCNVFFYATAGGWDKIRGLGVKKIGEYLRRFGFGASAGIDLTGEADGLVPTAEWKEKNKKEKWYQGDSYHLGIGQGDFLVTPLQIAMANAAIANGGRLIKPRLAKTIESPDGKISELPTEVTNNQVVSGKSIKVVQEGMRQAVTDGSARQLADLKDKNGQPVAAAGKTGTAQFGAADAEGKMKTHAWFAGYAPYDNPQILVVVFIEGGGEGFAAAEPVAKKMLEYWFLSRVSP
ncbi:MAG: penicillin-binding protein 2 [Candidatus Berkelbacteria bacterium Licking1014_2]|uniref:Penicillin-binding protein 2 n=1 Tax=Candidatus Berkelbacteria bacterium Licking1014_2 TaxID=2017146 RepID=A0A554LWB9_9BACT|nr:MAG: penicillin-binding protein 2 [Candidatus Berkelbacteria bacterium Licking1014_2]